MVDIFRNIKASDVVESIEIHGIGGFAWDIKRDRVMYSQEWARILGYELNEIDPSRETWKKVLHTEDYQYSQQSLRNYLAGKSPIYDAEFRLVRKDGEIIYGRAKGNITEFDEDGKPAIFCGVLQDVTDMKNAEKRILESEQTAKFVIETAEIGIWDWDMKTGLLSYNDQFLEMYGYTRENTNGTVEELESRHYPPDMPAVAKSREQLITGQAEKYQGDARLIHADGSLIWTRVTGKVAKRDENGVPTRIIGGCVNINELKKSQDKLELALESLEIHQAQLEAEIDRRTKDLVDRDKLLIAVNEVSRKLLSLEDYNEYESVTSECLEIVANAFDVCEISLWRLAMHNEKKYTYVEHSFSNGLKVNFDTSQMHEIIEELPDDNAASYITENGNIIISLSTIDKSYLKHIEKKNTVIEDFLHKVPKELQDAMKPFTSRYNTFLLAPVYVGDDLFGYVALSDVKANMTLSEAQEKMLLMVGNMFSTSRRKYELDEKLRIAHEEAILSSKAKSSFLANMSHEIRTPLNAILGMSEIIVRESKGDTSEEYAKEIKNASESLLSIINDILDLSKIESGKLEIVSVDYYITSLLNDIIGLSKVRLEDKPVILTTFIDSKIPAILHGDEIRIKQILINILSNAIKFTHEGNIDMSVTSDFSDGTAKLKFVITDTGIGIKKDDMEKLFMQFERVDTKKNRNIEGTGLGLAITKQLCEMMGGSIKVESELGKGSKFTVIIPQTYDEYLPIVSIPTTNNILVYEARELYAESIKDSIQNLGSKCVVCANQSELINILNDQDFDYLFVPTVHLSKIKKLKEVSNNDFDIVLVTDPGDTIIYRDTITANLPLNCLQLSSVFGHSDLLVETKTKIRHFVAPEAKILIVDDNQVNLKVASGLMAPYKFNIDTAINGAIAVEKVKNNEYDVVFMDHMMPEMDGIDATIAIRKLHGDYFANLPIIALTANALVGARELFVNEGMNDFLAKPIEMQKLHSALLQWIPKEKITFVSIKDDEDDSGSDISISIDGIDTSAGIRLIGGNIDDYFDVLSSFYNDGVQKVKAIPKSLNLQDMNSYRIDVHAVKSASASIGAMNLSELAKNLENASIKEDIEYIEANTDNFIYTYEKILDAIKEKLSTRNTDVLDKSMGEIAFLNAHLDTLSDALDLLDIDIIEQTLEECMKFEWKGEINNLLMSIKEFTDAFEYYNARPPFDEIKVEISKNY